MKKTIVIHFYIKNEIDYLKCINSHFYFFEKYANIFDDVIFVIAPEDKNDVKFIKYIADKVVDTFKNNNITIKIADNHYLHEANTLYNEVIMNKNLNGLVFFCHSKGGNFINENTLYWISCMYYYNLNFMSDVTSKLTDNNGVFYGTLLHYSNEPNSFNKNSAWYSGTFYWINICAFRKYLEENNIVIDKITDGFFAEKLPGELFHKEELNSLNNVMFETSKIDEYGGNYDEYVNILGYSNYFWEEYYKMIGTILKI